ncbi:MAG TPA: hypothetical protein ENH30_05755, partial [Nitrospirae bacterium]|nr:hypothetical protein [Nitrospirota bacterium]
MTERLNSKGIPHPIRPSTWDRILKYVASTENPSPCLLMDRDMIKEKVSAIGSGIDNAKVFYAVKANPDTDVVGLLNETGVDFEIASEGELRILASHGVKGDRIISSNPVKSVRFLREAFASGVNR